MRLNYKLTKEERWFEDHMHEYRPITPEEAAKISRELGDLVNKRTTTITVDRYVLEKLKKKAKQEGIHYFSLISAILYRFANNTLRETRPKKVYGKKKRTI